MDNTKSIPPVLLAVFLLGLSVTAPNAHADTLLAAGPPSVVQQSGANLKKVLAECAAIKKSKSDREQCIKLVKAANPAYKCYLPHDAGYRAACLKKANRPTLDALIRLKNLERDVSRAQARGDVAKAALEKAKKDYALSQKEYRRVSEQFKKLGGRKAIQNLTNAILK